MLHRFTDTADSTLGFPLRTLQAHLEWLRAHSYRLMSLRDLLDELRDGRPFLPKPVAFTIDDGYADFAELAAPVFARFDCPATVFLVTDFIDGKGWLWWDKVLFGLLQTSATQCRLNSPAAQFDYTWQDQSERRRVAWTIIEAIKYLPSDTRAATIQDLLTVLQVSPPEIPTREFAPMTWGQARALDSQQVTFGPHTTSHPILSLENDSTVEHEVVDSWNRVRTELPAPLPVFCFPNGDARAFGTREESIVQAAGLEACFSTAPGYVSSRLHGRHSPRVPPSLPRFSHEPDFTRFAQVVSGVEHFKSKFRSWLDGHQEPSRR